MSKMQANAGEPPIAHRYSPDFQQAGPMEEPYVLDAQVGFLLRVLYQRNSALLAEALDGLTPTQWAAISKLEQLGECSQNLLGRHTAMDAATIKGVVDRLVARGLMRQRPDPMHARRLLVSLSPTGKKLYTRSADAAREVSDATVGNLNSRERQALLRLLAKACNWPVTPDGGVSVEQ